MNNTTRKHHAPQFELPVDSFNLASQTSRDGARLAQERGQRERDQAASDRKQAELFTVNPKKP